MVIVLMGVAGSGKTTLGQGLAQALQCPFFDSDDYHSQKDKDKMASGIALTDEDRLPWLKDISKNVKDWNFKYPVTVLACSALKQSYRDIIGQGSDVRWVYLTGDKDLIQRRLEERRGHFAGPNLLESQWETLEEPAGAIGVNINEKPDKIVEELLKKINNQTEG